jgi:hypothetical protein
MKQKGEIITCITTELIQDNGSDESTMWRYLTFQKDYQVINNLDGYTIIDDSGRSYTFPYENFHTKQELRQIKLKLLGI